MMWAVLFIVGCGFSEDRFLVDGYQRWCDRSAECAGTFEPSSCIDVLRSQDRSGCTYDPELGKACWEELEAAECYDDPLLDLPVLQVPASCDAAYDCGGQ